jgi:hypothetical protein
MKKKVFFAALVAATTLFATSCSKDEGEPAENVVTITFSDLTLAANSYWNGSDESGGFTSGIATFNNSFTNWGGGFISWSGFGYSNQNDTATAGYGNQFSVYTTSANANGIFAVGYVSSFDSDDAPSITFDEPVALKKADFALNTYAYKSMRDGDDVAKKFADGDWYKITISGYDSDGDETASLDVYLADFRNGKSVLTGNWTSVDLSSLGSVSKLTFAASSSDVGDWGMNTPGYFCIDNIAYVK